MVGPNDWLRQKDLTYLELPPDEQKVSKRPNTNIISDKDRIATSRTPQLDTKELKQDSGQLAPGNARLKRATAASRAAAQAAPAPAAQSTPTEQPAPQHPAMSPDQMAKLQTPQTSPPRPNLQYGRHVCGIGD